MPLPSEGQSWPPDENGTHASCVREWSAWYSGAPDQLEAFYGPKTGAAAHPSVYRGGAVGKLARWWWGTPTSEGEQRSKLHVPLAADIATASADLLFSEPVKITPAEPKNNKLAAFIADMMDDGLDSRLHESAEVGAALGGVFLRVTWDSNVSPFPWTTAVHPDGAVPEFRNGRLYAVNLWSVLQRESNGGPVWRHIERHEPGYIVHALYKGTATNLGKRQPLQAHPVTLALLGTGVAEDGTQPTGTQRLTVTYVPNMLPNRMDRHSLQGRSDFQGVTPLFDALDEVYSSWWRDIRLAKGRLHVPATYMDSDAPGAPGTVDVDREVYVPVQTLAGTAGELQITATQFAIRVAEHAQTAQEWRDLAVQSAGYSPATFGDSTEGGAMTATEVVAKERRTYRTRGKKARYWTAGLRHHLPALVEVATAQLHAGITDSAVRVEFPDGVQESPLQLANTALALRNAQAASVETVVRMVNPDWTGDQVTAEAEKIMAEDGANAAPLPVPGDAGF